MSDKTLAMRLLEGKGIAYAARHYDASVRDAEQVAALLDESADRVYKSLVVLRPPAKPVLALVAADQRVDLKKLAKALGEKKVKMAKHKEAESLTGLEVGGITPLALINRGFSFVIDVAAKEHERIILSAGERGKQVEVAVEDLVRVTGASFASVSAATDDVDNKPDDPGQHHY
ncbi:MAG: YbaK/EbsC family protein [Candidatus Promineifilaceae bacterium]|nr:YbaK/EbsC family protein [Candidatus Promineifilaceae bacterium]